MLINQKPNLGFGNVPCTHKKIQIKHSVPIIGLVFCIITFALSGCELFNRKYRPSFEHGYSMGTGWGSVGTEISEFKDPYGSDIDVDNNLIYVADCKNDRIQIFTLDGVYVKSIGEPGTGMGQLDGPADVKVGLNDYIYVVEEYNHRIQVFEADGTHRAFIGSMGAGEGEFSYPLGVALDSIGNIYVADYRNDRIQKFSADGQFLMKWGTRGDGDGEFNGPYYIEIDKKDNLFVVDRNNNRIQKFDNNGIYISKWGRNGGDGSPGTGVGEFNYPHEVAVDLAGNVYVADLHNNRFQVFTGDGDFLGSWGNSDLFGLPKAIAVDNEYNVFVVDIVPAVDSLDVVTRWSPRKMERCTFFDSDGCVSG